MIIQAKDEFKAISVKDTLSRIFRSKEMTGN
jgi:hypothetical protein